MSFLKTRERSKKDLNFDQIKEAKSPVTSFQHLIISRMN